MAKYEEQTEEVLQKQFDEIAAVLKAKKDAKISTAISQIESIALAAGLQVSIKGHRKQNEKVVKKFKDPNSSEIWQGTGRKPAWLRALLKENKDISAYEVKDEQPATA